MKMLSWFMAPFALYAAFLTDVVLRSVIESTWRPNLMLLAAFSVLRTRISIVWSATAGLMCDGMADRPLGVTMLAATLAATIFREVTRGDADSVSWFLAKAMVFVAVIECSARMMTSMVSDAPNGVGALASGMQAALATMLIAALLIPLQRLASRISKPRDYQFAGRWAIGRVR